jgi:hypothetical protein
MTTEQGTGKRLSHHGSRVTGVQRGAEAEVARQ